MNAPVLLHTAPVAAVGQRFLSLDVARGLIMIIMALDHASMLWNAGRAAPEMALSGFPVTQYSNGLQQLTREITHLCAPGFQLLAGVGMALSVCRRERSGAAGGWISADMLLRAVVLFFCEWVLLGVFVGAPRYFFIVLCCIGSATALFALARLLPMGVIAVLSTAVLLSAPLYGPMAVEQPSAGGYLTNIWTRVALSESETAGYCVLYPVLPWIGFFGVGWCLGCRYAAGQPLVGPRLATIGLALIVGAVILRWFGGGYGDRFPGGYAGPFTAAFWQLAKYPPSPAFSLLTLGGMLLLIGLLNGLDEEGPSPAMVRFVAVFGRTALFFYIVHFYVLGTYPLATGTAGQYSLGVTYLAWAGALGLMWPLCLGYGTLRARYNRVLRYF